MIEEKMTNTKDDGDCYIVHGDMIAEKFMTKTGKGWLLCHGQAIGRDEIEGVKHGHAWLEREGKAYDYSNGMTGVFTQEDYYKLGNIIDIKRYTPKQASTLMAKTNHYGAWNETERAIVGLK